jgi:hypothetical protein
MAGQAARWYPLAMFMVLVVVESPTSHRLALWAGQLTDHSARRLRNMAPRILALPLAAIR